MLFHFMYEWRARQSYRSRKKIDKNKFNGRKKLSVVFDRPMSNVYEKNIFPTLPCAAVEIHENTANTAIMVFTSK